MFGKQSVPSAPGKQAPPFGKKASAKPSNPANDKLAMMVKGLNGKQGC